MRFRSRKGERVCFAAFSENPYTQGVRFGPGLGPNDNPFKQGERFGPGGEAR